MYREAPVPETEYGAELLTASIVLKPLNCCGVTFAIGIIDGIVEVEIPDPTVPAPLVVVRTIPVIVLPPETMVIGFCPPDRVATDTGMVVAFLPPVMANGMGITVVDPDPPEFDTDRVCGPPITCPWLTVTICGDWPDRPDPTEPAFMFTIWVICPWDED